MVRKVRYIGGSGGLLLYPLSDGRSEFFAGITYEVENYDDFMRLMNSNDFEEVLTPSKPQFKGDKK